MQETSSWGRPVPERIAGPLRGIGRQVVDGLWRLGYATRFFALTLVRSAVSFRRFRLTMRELYFAGVLSLIIILVSGLFVGMVLALQGYETLQRFGASESLGVLVALSLVRELGPVVAGLLFASRAGSAITAEIGLMKATEQISAMEMMAVDPIARVVAPRFWGGVISMPLLAALFSAAAAGELLTAVGVQTQVQRMLADSKAQSFVADFITDWLDVNVIASRPKDAKLYAMWNQDLANAMETEFRSFGTTAVLGSGLFSELLTGNKSSVNQALATVYGVSGITGTTIYVDKGYHAMGMGVSGGQVL